MNQQIKQQWIDALRGGKYDQTYGEIRNGSDKFCVNGVLCDLHSRLTQDGEGWLQIGKCWAWFYQLHRFPDGTVQEWAEVDSDTLLDLERMNDKERRTFHELADYIEQYL